MDDIPSFLHYIYIYIYLHLHVGDELLHVPDLVHSRVVLPMRACPTGHE